MTSRSRAFDEWPLVVFTSLAIMGAGLWLTPLVAWLAGAPPAAAHPVLWFAPVLFICGFIVSQAHLGQPWRATLAARGIGMSRLSAEIVALIVLMAVGTTMVSRGETSALLQALTSLAALAFLLTLGFVYALRGQGTWRGAVMFSPLTLALGFGLLALTAVWDGAVLSVGHVAAVVLAADVTLLTVRRLRLTFPRHPMLPLYPAYFARRQHLLALRLLMVDLLPGALLAVGLPRPAVACLALGILTDRIAFYALASQHSTEAEIGAIEAEM